MPTDQKQRSKKDEQSERSRAKLLAAATELFAERGYRETSVQAIAERGGISRGSIFWHFGSKEELLTAVAEQAFAEWEREVLVTQVGDATGIEAVRRVLKAHREFLVERSTELRLFHLMMFEALGPRPELAEPFAGLHVHLRDLGSRWLAAGIEDGSLRPDLDSRATATIITGALGGIAYQWLLDPEGVDVERVYEDLEKTLISGLAA